MTMTMVMVSVLMEALVDSTMLMCAGTSLEQEVALTNVKIDFFIRKFVDPPKRAELVMIKIVCGITLREQNV